MTAEARSGAICVDGGVVTALEGVYGSSGIIVAAGTTAHRATVTAADPVSGLAYLTGITCPNGAMSMPEAATPAAGTRVHVLARVAGSTGVRSTAVRVSADAGRVEGARTGTAVVYSSRRQLITRILHLPISEFDASFSAASRSRNALVPDRAIVPRFSMSSASVMPMPLSLTVSLRPALSKLMRIERRGSAAMRSGFEMASYRSLSQASDALEMSSRRKISFSV